VAQDERGRADSIEGSLQRKQRRYPLLFAALGAVALVILAWALDFFAAGSSQTPIEVKNEITLSPWPSSPPPPEEKPSLDWTRQPLLGLEKGDQVYELTAAGSIKLEHGPIWEGTLRLMRDEGGYRFAIDFPGMNAPRTFGPLEGVNLPAAFYVKGIDQGDDQTLRNQSLGWVVVLERFKVSPPSDASAIVRVFPLRMMPYKGQRVFIVRPPEGTEPGS
jgi:hypothetical protein